jgi:uncharacterized protein (DUF934 family)
MEARQMANKLIKDGKAQPDSWHLLDNTATGQSLSALDNKDIIVPLAFWAAEATALGSRNGRTGVWLNSHELPAALAADIHAIPLIALNFPEFKDGRAFSSARELRQRMAYTGEIRAIGDVLRDQLFFMRRCGFNAFDLRDDQDLEAALAAFDDFHDTYQSAIDQPLPLFRRRQE